MKIFAMKKIAITGAAGQVAYSLLPRLASGAVLKEPLTLSLLEKKGVALQGVVEELSDGMFPLLQKVLATEDPKEAFKDADYILMLGASPRKKGQKREDVAKINASIFWEQGRILNEHGKKSASILVVGNPCNDMAWILTQSAPRFKTRIHALTLLDQNRATYQLAKRANVSVSKVSQVTIWGDHSMPIPDWSYATIDGKPVQEVIEDKKWLEQDFHRIVQKRGDEILSLRSFSSALSAAEAILHWLHCMEYPSTFSSAFHSFGNPYGIDEDLIFSFPCISKGKGDVMIAPNLQWPHHLEKAIFQAEEKLKKRLLILSHLR